MTLVPNPNSPYTYANILFIDTLGVGFSFAHDIKDIPTTYLQMS
jgi:carboxypeptidase C (cathepsin A)